MSDPLAPLRAKFLARCADDADLLSTADAAAPSDEARLTVHRLAGAAGVFGYHDITGLARTLDDQVHAEGRMHEADLQALLDALAALDASRTAD
jgi:HPt (histidine-containing phosphotransfer) domain-containing protein